MIHNSSFIRFQKYRKKIFKRIGLTYLVYILACNTIPFLVPKKTSEDFKEKLATTDFYHDGETGPERVALLESPEDAFSARIALLKEAKETLDIVYYKIQPGSSTDAFWGEVLAAADRGVVVRIFLDGKNYLFKPDLSKTLKALNEHENISCQKYLPVNFMKPWEWQGFLHDKFIVADHRVLILGGRNLGDRFYAPADYDGTVTYDRDVLVWKSQVEAPADKCVITQVEAYMDLLWQSSQATEMKTSKKGHNQEKHYQILRENTQEFEVANPVFYKKTIEDYLSETVATHGITLLTNPINTGKKEPWVAYSMGQLALNAEKSVLIQTPYATANPDLLQCLKTSNQKSSATILTNSRASSPNYPAFSNYYSQRKKFLETGASIYEFQSQDSIHGKSMVVDEGLSLVGTFNMDDRSFYIDTETMLVIDSEEFSEKLTQAIGNLQEESLMVDQQTNTYIPQQQVKEATVPTWKKILMGIVSVFSRLLQSYI